MQSFLVKLWQTLNTETRNNVTERLTEWVFMCLLLDDYCLSLATSLGMLLPHSPLWFSRSIDSSLACFSIVSPSKMYLSRLNFTCPFMFLVLKSGSMFACLVMWCLVRACVLCLLFKAARCSRFLLWVWLVIFVFVCFIIQIIKAPTEVAIRKV